MDQTWLPRNVSPPGFRFEGVERRILCRLVLLDSKKRARTEGKERRLPCYSFVLFQNWLEWVKRRQSVYYFLVLFLCSSFPCCFRIRKTSFKVLYSLFSFSSLLCIPSYSGCLISWFLNYNLSTILRRIQTLFKSNTRCEQMLVNLCLLLSLYSYHLESVKPVLSRRKKNQRLFYRFLFFSLKKIQTR